MPEGVAMPDRLDRLTADAQTALRFAQEEALRFNQKYVGTEHILLGLLRQDNGPAAKLLRSLGVDMERLPAAVRSHMERGYRSVYDELPLTPGAEKAIDLAFDEARRLRSKTVGAEHLLAGLAGEGEGLAARGLEGVGVSLERLRPAVASPPPSARIIDG